MKDKILKSGILLVLLINIHQDTNGQTYYSNRDNRIFTSVDLTFLGPQVSLAYDFYTKKERCFGFSISQARGLEQKNGEPTYYYNPNDMRLNFSFRYTNHIFESKIVDAFFIMKAGLSYNTALGEGSHLILPSFNVGGGVDLKVFKSSGVRLEAGLGSPYCASIGYFFKY